MILYIFLLLLIAIFSYSLGSMDTVVLASNFVFRRSLNRLGRGNLWISNFRRIYGLRGFLLLLLVELIKDILPVLFGALLLGFKEHADVGRAFAAFCTVVGRLYPIFYDFKGSHASICMIVAAFAVDGSVGAATLIVVVAASLVLRYLSLGTVIAALAYLAVTILVVDDSLLQKLVIYTVLIVIFKHIPSLIRVFTGREERLNFTEDITYKLDQ